MNEETVISIIVILIWILIELLAHFVIYGTIALSVLVSYILESISIMKISKKLSVPRGWRAWIPFASNYQLGKIAEKDDEVYNPTDAHPKWSKIMLGGSVCYTVVLLLALCTMAFLGLLVFISFIVFAVLSAENNMSGEQIMPIFGVMYIGYILVAGLTSILSTCYQVLIYIVYYKVFHVMVEDNAWWILLLMLLGIPFASIVALLIFAFSKKFPVYKRAETLTQ